MTAPTALQVIVDKQPLRVLIVEDCDDDAALLLHELGRGGFEVDHQRVETVDALRRALTHEDWQLVVSDYSLPTMTAHDVLRTVHAERPDLPCIVISGTITEDAAVEVLRAGARDFIVKERLARLIPAITRELNEATERRRRRDAEATLHDTRERMEFAMESVGIGTWEVDLATGRAIWSDVLEKLHGLAPGTFGGTLDAFFATIHQDDRHLVIDQIQQATRERRDSRMQYRTRWPDGSLHWLLGIGRTVCDQVGTPVRMVGVGMDITAQKHLEEQVRQSQKMESIGNLAGGVAHDFNNLLTVITGCCDLIGERPWLEPAIAEPLEQIRSAAVSATALTRQLLTFSRRQFVQPRLSDLNEIIESFSKILRRLVEENVQIVFQLDPRQQRVRVDSGQIEQVLLNLVANARDAMTNGGTVTIETSRTKVDAHYSRMHPDLPEGTYVVLSVSDTGSGMTPDVQAHLFEPFFTTKPRGQGTGLGLPTVYGIVKQSGGHISVYSEVGMGTTFRVHLPYVSSGSVEEAVTTDKAGPTDLRGSETVLVVEDNAVLRGLNEHILQRYGYSVLIAEDGAEAQRICEHHDGPIHVVVMDIVMPGDSGPSVGEWISQRRPGTKIVYISGYAGDALDRHTLMQSGNTFLPKPFKASQLARAVREVLTTSGPVG
jgi:PAS domain S-box-containing protein